MRSLSLSIAASSLLFACSAEPAAGHSEHHPSATEVNAQKEGGHHEPHVISHDSQADFETTLAQLQAAIDAKGFKTFAVIDHSAGAASIDQTLRPTTLIIFGNPNGGTPVMQAKQMIGLELPLKMLVAQGDDGVTLTWRDMQHTFHEYGIADHPAAEKMSAMLATIAADAGR